MSTVVLARKYRPKSFDQMVGQEHVVRALTNALQQQRLHHAYLFTGTRGIGKTTVSRILAKSLNCTGADGTGGITAHPCGVCQACTEIDADRYLDYIELDAASNRSIDEVRDLIERAAYKPGIGRFKVFMIDEAHQLTKDAFNALLKTLEEPPEYLKFVLATTDPDKMLPTVLSRCLQFNLRPMAPETVRDHLAQVLAAENVAHDDGALRLLATAARGSMRDALSLTDQAIAYGAGRLDAEVVRAMLGSVDRSHAATIVAALARRDGPALLAAVDGLRSLGLSASGLLDEMAALLQQMAVAQVVAGALDADAADTAGTLELAALLPPDETQLLYSIVLQGRAELALLSDEYGALTMVLLRLLAFPPAGGAAVQAEAPRAARAAAAPAPRPPPAAPRAAPLRAASSAALVVPVAATRLDGARAAAAGAPVVAAAPPAVAVPVAAQPVAGAEVPLAAQPVAGAKVPLAAQPVAAAEVPLAAQPAPAAEPPLAAKPASGGPRPAAASAPAAAPGSIGPRPAMELAPSATLPSTRPRSAAEPLPAAQPVSVGPRLAVGSTPAAAPAAVAPRPAAEPRVDRAAPAVQPHAVRSPPAVEPRAVRPALDSAAVREPAPRPWQAQQPQPPHQPQPASPLAERWDALARQLGQRGSLVALVRELAWQASLVDADDAAVPRRWRLAVERESLRAPALAAKLAAAIEAVAGHAVALELVAGTPADTPARRDAAERDRLQALAEQTIRSDPLVTALLAQFKTARIVPGSIKPA